MLIIPNIFYALTPVFGPFPIPRRGRNSKCLPSGYCFYKPAGFRLTIYIIMKVGNLGLP